MQFLHRALRFIDRLHLDESESFRTLVVFVGDNLSVLHLTDAVEELEKIALARVEGEVADVKSGRRHFDCFGSAHGALALRRTVAACMG
jgi:hypothetical protein